MEDFKSYRKVTYPTVQENRYIISEFGKIYDTISERFVKAHEDKDGYLRVRLSKKNVSIHRAVAWEFCQNRDMTLCVDHVDGNKKNNHYSNLEWVTSAENTRRAQAMGLRHNSGEENVRNIYPESLIRDICQMFVDGMSNMDVYYKISGKDRLDMNSKKDGALYSLIFNLRKKSVWNHVTKDYDYDTTPGNSKKKFMIKENSFFTEQEVRKICELRCSGMNPKAICEAFGVTSQDDIYRRYMERVCAVIAGRTWSYITKDYNLPPTVKHVDRSELDSKVLDMLNKGYPPERIYASFGGFNTSADPLYRAIRKRIKKYQTIKAIPNSTDIKIDESVVSGRVKLL